MKAHYWLSLVVAAGMLLAVLLGACAAPTPTVAPAATKPAAAAATSAPATAATTVPAAATTKPAAAAPTAAPTAAPVSKIKRGGTLRTAQPITYPTFDTHLTVAGTQPSLISMYDSLLRYDLVDEKTGKHELKPELAESWKVVDPKTITFELRKGVKFHDGSDFNAEVVKWNFDRAMTHQKSAVKTAFASIDKIEVVSPTSIKMNLKRPSAELLINLTPSPGGSGATGALIMSKANFDKRGEDQAGANPSGTGPFMLDKWLRDDRVIAKKFDAYWKMGADGKPLPYLDAHEDRFIQDPSVTLLEIRSGTVDLTENVDAKDIAAVKSNPDMVYWEQPWCAMGIFSWGVNQTVGPFAGNQKLRHALEYALDRDSMIKALTFGTGSPAPYLQWLPTHPGYDPSLPKREFNLAKAKQLVAEAGYPNGIDTSLIFISRPVDQRTAEAAKAMWDAAGIRIKLDAMERLAWIDKMKLNNFEIGFFRSNGSPDPAAFNKFHQTKQAANYANYSNPEVDKCLEEGASEYDVAKRHEIYKRCLKTMLDDAYYGIGYMLPYNRVFRKVVKDVRVQFGVTDLKETWIDK
jgi:peptide/nickel transport system substrate-binding protein